MCPSMKTSSSQFSKKCGAASHLSKLCSSRRSAMKSTQRVPARLQPYNCFNNRHGTEVDFSNALGHETCFVLVHVELRVGHVCCECVICLVDVQKNSMTHPVLGVKLGALRGQRATYATEYLVRVGTELAELRNGILALMDENLIPSASTGESKVFYYKMKDDYYKNFAEFAPGVLESQVAEDACAACAGNTKIAEGQTYSLFQKSLSASLQATTLARRLSKQEHCTALAELTVRISAIMMVGAGAGDDPFVKIMCLITFLINKLQAEAPSEASHTSYRLKGRGRRQRRRILKPMTRSTLPNLKQL